MIPIQSAFRQFLPEAVLSNLLDDSLSADLQSRGELTSDLLERFKVLTQYVVQNGADAVLFTCSAFGPAIAAAAASVTKPVLKPNEAMFLDALEACAHLGRPARIGMLSTFAPSIAPMAKELADLADARGIEFSLHSECPNDAFHALHQGNQSQHDLLVCEAAKHMRDQDVVLLGQFSMAHLHERLASQLISPVFSSPRSAVRALRHRLGQHAHLSAFN